MLTCDGESQLWHIGRNDTPARVRIFESSPDSRCDGANPIGLGHDRNVRDTDGRGQPSSGVREHPRLVYPRQSA